MQCIIQINNPTFKPFFFYKRVNEKCSFPLAFICQHTQIAYLTAYRHTYIGIFVEELVVLKFQVQVNVTHSNTCVVFVSPWIDIFLSAVINSKIQLLAKKDIWFYKNNMTIISIQIIT